MHLDPGDMSRHDQGGHRSDRTSSRHGPRRGRTVRCMTAGFATGRRCSSFLPVVGLIPDELFLPLLQNGAGHPDLVKKNSCILFTRSDVETVALSSSNSAVVDASRSCFLAIPPWDRKRFFCKRGDVYSRNVIQHSTQ